MVGVPAPAVALDDVMATEPVPGTGRRDHGAVAVGPDTPDTGLAPAAAPAPPETPSQVAVTTGRLPTALEGVVTPSALDVVPAIAEGANDLIRPSVPAPGAPTDHVVAAGPTLTTPAVRAIVAGVLPGVTVPAAVLTERAGLPPIERARGRIEGPVPPSATVREAAARRLGPRPVKLRDLRPGVVRPLSEVRARPMARLGRAPRRPTVVGPVTVAEGAPPLILQDVGA